MSDIPEGATAALLLADGSVFWGRGFGAHGTAVAEICFNTGMTGYQETLTDPSYAGQIINFTFPHIGNVGCNAEDEEAANPAARGLVVKQDITEPANYRSTAALQAWLQRHGLPGIAGVDTRALTMRIRDGGAPNGVLHFPADGAFDIAALTAQAAAWPGLEGMGPREGSHHPAELPLGWRHLGLGPWLPRAAAGPAQGRGAGLRRQAQHFSESGPGRLRHHRVAGDGHRRGDSGACAGWRVSQQRPRRPGSDRRLPPFIASRARTDQDRPADLRHLPRPPAAGPGARGEDLQA